MRTTQTGVRQANLRSVNLAVVLSHVLAQHSPCSRADVAAATGMTRSTVSRLVDELVAVGLLAELDPVVGGQRGRPAVPLVAPRGTIIALGLEINVRRLVARAVDLSGEVVAEEVAEGEFAGSEPIEVFARIAEMGRSCLARTGPEAQLAGVQLALPGLVDGASGELLRAPNLGWSRLDAMGLLEAQGLAPKGRIWVANEADCAALTVAEAAPRRGSDYDQFLYLSGEVGIGSAVVLGGRVMTGRHGWAGEVGHTCVDPHGEVCACGARGCLERYAGQAALLQAAGASDLDDLLARLDADDEQSVRAVERAAHALGIALSNAMNLLDVSIVVLGGHLGALSERLAPTALAEVRARVLSAPFDPPVVSSIDLALGAPATGAAYGVLDRLVDDPVQLMDGNSRQSIDRSRDAS